MNLNREKDEDEERRITAEIPSLGSENDVNTVAAGCQIDTYSTWCNSLTLELVERSTTISTCPSSVERRLGTMDELTMNGLVKIEILHFEW